MANVQRPFLRALMNRTTYFSCNNGFSRLYVDFERALAIAASSPRNLRHILIILMVARDQSLSTPGNVINGPTCPGNSTTRCTFYTRHQPSHGLPLDVMPRIFGGPPPYAPVNTHLPRVVIDPTQNYLGHLEELITSLSHILETSGSRNACGGPGLNVSFQAFQGTLAAALRRAPSDSYRRSWDPYRDIYVQTAVRLLANRKPRVLDMMCNDSTGRMTAKRALALQKQCAKDLSRKCVKDVISWGIEHWGTEHWLTRLDQIG